MGRAWHGKWSGVGIVELVRFYLDSVVDMPHAVLCLHMRMQLCCVYFVAFVFFNSSATVHTRELRVTALLRTWASVASAAPDCVYMRVWHLHHFLLPALRCTRAWV
mgnify:CR=1 FL=1